MKIQLSGAEQETVRLERHWRRMVRRLLRRGVEPNSLIGSIQMVREGLRRGALERPKILENLEMQALEAALHAGIDAAGIAWEATVRRLPESDGVVYTPRFIADRLAAEALGSGEGPILDPACGAGVLLDSALRLLLTRNPPGTPEAARVLVDQLHGADTDAEAVEIARTTLALTAWEALPDPTAVDWRTLIPSGVVVGDGLQTPWPEYPSIVGNPPYVPEEDHRDLFAPLRASDRWRPRAEPRMDYGQFFLHLGLDQLAEGGCLAYILPATWFVADGAAGLRRRLEEGPYEIDLDTLPESLRPFADTAPGQRNVILRVRRTGGERLRPMSFGAAVSVALCRDERDRAEELERHASRRLGDVYEVRQGIVPGPDVVTPKALKRLHKADPQTCKAWLKETGIRPGMGVFVLTREEAGALDLTDRERDLLRPFYRASEVRGEGFPGEPTRFILYLTPETAADLDGLPAIAAHLARFRPLMDRRRETVEGLRAWFHLHWPRTRDLFEPTGDAWRVIVPRQTPEVRVLLTDEPAYVDVACNVIRRRPGTRSGRGADLASLAAWLEGPEVRAWLWRYGKHKHTQLQIDGNVLRRIPLPR